jgi:hypothetical protein
MHDEAVSKRAQKEAESRQRRLWDETMRNDAQTHAAGQSAEQEMADTGEERPRFTRGSNGISKRLPTQPYESLDYHLADSLEEDLKEQFEEKIDRGLLRFRHVPALPHHERARELDHGLPVLVQARRLHADDPHVRA